MQLLYAGAHWWWEDDNAYLAAFVAVWEVAVSGEASRSKGLPSVGMLWSLQGDKTTRIKQPSLHSEKMFG